MPFVENYLSKVGLQTGDGMKRILFELLLARYQVADKTDRSDKLAASVVNCLFCEVADNSELRSFEEENRALIESKAKELSAEGALCRALTCAVYNFCYGKYVDSGGKVGMFFHPFLGYVRALQEVVNGKEPASFLESFESKVGQRNIAPLLNLWLLGLYRSLPHTPDSKLMMDEVISFGKSVRSSVVASTSLSTNTPPQTRTAQPLRPSLPPIDDAAESIAVIITGAFSSAQFTDLFQDQTLPGGWTMGAAFAVWCSLGNLALVIAAWQTYDDQTSVFRIIDSCRPKLIKHWKLSGDILEKLRAVVNETEATAVSAFGACKTGSDLSLFFRRYVSRILGAPVAFTGQSVREDLLSGISYQGDDPVLAATVCDLFVQTCTSVKRLLAPPQ
ncbi:MAG TPA: hypothetical protein VN310_01220 [Candidatus Dormibacteraeota bacterium]|jgi:hypothetical protein|nr:hypothetical protein [Candidatus Dormibacteraeota bacterium]